MFDMRSISTVYYVYMYVNPTWLNIQNRLNSGLFFYNNHGTSCFLCKHCCRCIPHCFSYKCKDESLQTLVFNFTHFVLTYIVSDLSFGKETKMPHFKTQFYCIVFKQTVAQLREMHVKSSHRNERPLCIYEMFQVQLLTSPVLMIMSEVKHNKMCIILKLMNDALKN